jgi:hypothetical protein
MIVETSRMFVSPRRVVLKVISDVRGFPARQT